ncbi:hypothetical protein JYK04_00882 [Streptomyces nojiriensis]|nr:hypothetical protein JYK04_00882 [Streptomyces nojiriensis]
MLRALGPAEREVLFGHERAHLAGRHHLLSVTAHLAGAVHPALRSLRPTLEFHLERWADEAAASAVGNRRLAATAIARAALAAASGKRPDKDHGPLMSVGTGPVPQRVEALLQPVPGRPRAGSKVTSPLGDWMRRVRQGNGSSNPSEQTVELLVVAGKAVETLVAERSGARVLSLLHQSALKTLSDLGPHARDDLAARLETPPADVSRVIDDLLGQDLVRSMVVNVGGQHEVVTLTAAGAAARAATLGDMKDVQDVLLASITKGERAQLHYLLRRVCATAARAEHGRSRV